MSGVTQSLSKIRSDIDAIPSTAQQIVNADVGGVGTLAFLSRSTSNASISLGQVVAGSSLRYSGVSGNAVNSRLSWGGTPSGTWKALGYCSLNYSEFRAVTLFKRIA